MKILVPMAGRGSRYANRGFETPKPLIEIAGRPMLLWALDSLAEIACSEIIFVLLAEHEAQYKVTDLVRANTTVKTTFVTIPEVTQGQLCTILAAQQYIDTEEDVLIVASDTFIKSDLGNDILHKTSDCAGIISVINLPGEQWSFAKTDAAGRVVAVAEKVRISDHASNGLYYFSKGADLVKYGQEMIRRDERTRGEFYVIPVYQKMIDDGKTIVLSQAAEMWDMGTPEAKTAFENYLQQR